MVPAAGDPDGRRDGEEDTRPGPEHEVRPQPLPGTAPGKGSQASPRAALTAAQSRLTLPGEGAGQGGFGAPRSRASKGGARGSCSLGCLRDPGVAAFPLPQADEASGQHGPGLVITPRRLAPRERLEIGPPLLHLLARRGPGRGSPAILKNGPGASWSPAAQGHIPSAEPIPTTRLWSGEAELSCVCFLYRSPRQSSNTF